MATTQRGLLLLSPSSLLLSSPSSPLVSATLPNDTEPSQSGALETGEPLESPQQAVEILNARIHYKGTAPRSLASPERPSE